MIKTKEFKYRFSNEFGNFKPAIIGLLICGGVIVFSIKYFINTIDNIVYSNEIYANKEISSSEDSLEKEKIFSVKIGTLGWNQVYSKVVAKEGGGDFSNKITRKEFDILEKLKLEKESFFGIKIKDWKCKYLGDKTILKDEILCMSPYYYTGEKDRYPWAGKTYFRLIIDNANNKYPKIFKNDALQFSGTISKVEYADAVFESTSSIKANIVTVNELEVKIIEK